MTGAPVYDQWFARRPNTTRDEFCRKAGLPADKPFFLYLCSSQFIAPDESVFIAKWIDAVRSAADPRVRDAGLLIRPHPENLQPWQRFDFSVLRDVVLWPRGGANPVDAGSKNDYFDSMYHAAAAIGINTSAQIEAGIVGRPVFSVRVPEYAGTQEGTLHFHYLLSENGGLLHMADSLEEHTRQLAVALDRTEGDARHAAGLRQGVRPARGTRRGGDAAAGRCDRGAREDAEAGALASVDLGAPAPRRVLPGGTGDEGRALRQPPGAQARAAAASAHGQRLLPEARRRHSRRRSSAGGRQKRSPSATSCPVSCRR